MEMMEKRAERRGIARWSTVYIMIFLALTILVTATMMWVRSTERSSQETVRDLGQFYLSEIVQRGVGNITARLDEVAAQVARTLDMADASDLADPEALRRYVGRMQQVNDFAIFALMDDQGTVYTADSSLTIEEWFTMCEDSDGGPHTHVVRNAQGQALLLLTMPVTPRQGASIQLRDCLVGLRVERLITAEQLQNDQQIAHGRLFTRNGENLLEIAGGTYQNGRILFDIWTETADFLPGYSLAETEALWRAGREGYTVYATDISSTNYVYFKPVPGTDLMLSALMKENDIRQEVEENTTAILRDSVVYLASVISAIIVLGFLTVRIVEKMRRSQIESNRLQIVSALSNDYSDVFLMEPRRGKSFSIKVRGEMVPSPESASRDYMESWLAYVKQYVAAEDAAHVLDAVMPDRLTAALREKPEYILEFRTRLADGYHHYQFKFVRLPGGDDQLIVGVRNIDRQVEAEQARQRELQDALTAAQHANMAKTIFLNNMSHDIRTPMNAIIGFTSLAATHLDKPDQVCDYLKKIQTAGNHLMNLINDVLDMSRIESGKVKVENAPVHLPDVIHSLRTIVQADIRARQLDFRIDIVDVVNEDVICDKLRINQILLNLLSNAMKFTPAGGTVRLRIIQTKDAPAGYADYEFRVKDTGIGIGREFQEHIFEAFTRERTSTVSGIQGTGLGMAITKSIVDIMGGDISVISEEGKGTEFIVRLRFRIDEEKPASDAVLLQQGRRVLVVDPEADTCRMLAAMLETIGMRPEWTTSGKDAVHRAQRAIKQGDAFYGYMIDSLITDTSSIEVVRRVRSMTCKGRPIIVLTACDLSEIEQEAHECGATAFCAKPLFLSELREVLSAPHSVNERQKNVTAAAPDFTGKRLLLAEDNDLNQEIAVAILSTRGFTVDVVADGQDAVAAIEQAAAGYYDLVLMDIQMPHMDGYEATRRIRALADNEKGRVPIVAMTANAFEEDRQKAFAAGMNGHLGKPIRVEEVFALLEQLLFPRPE